MWIVKVMLLLLLFGMFNQAPVGETESSVDGKSEDDFEPPKKKLKSACYFSTPRLSPLEKIDRDSHHKVSTPCEGAAEHSMVELADNFDGKFFGAPHELGRVLGTGEGTFLDENSDVEPWREEVICPRHLNELSRAFFDDEYGHVKKMRGESGGKDKACGYPEENHLARPPRRTMSHTMSKNVLLLRGQLVPAGIPLCDRHYNAIPKQSISPRCSQSSHQGSQADIDEGGTVSNFLANDVAPVASQIVDAINEHLPVVNWIQENILPSGANSQASSMEVDSDDGDSCYVDKTAGKESTELEKSLDKFLKLANIDRAWCRKPIDTLSGKYQRSKGRTVVQIMQTVVGLLTQTDEDYNQLMTIVTELMAGKTLMEDNAILHSMMTAVADKFNRLVKSVEKVQLLSIFASSIKYRTITDYIPDLSERMWNDAKKKAMSPPKGMPDVARRERYSTDKIDLFVSFITSAHVMVGLPWGVQKTKDSAGNTVTLPNTIRLTGIYETIEMYETWCEQLGEEPLSNSTTYKLLSYFPALRSSSKNCVDYFSASATMAFIRIQEILKELGAMNLLDTTEAAALKHYFEQIQVYLRTDYKLHVKEESRIADHCWHHSLSDPVDERFSAPPRGDHEHDWTCPTCERMEFIFRDLGKRISDWATFADSADSEAKLLEMDWDFRSAFDKIMDHKAHIVRTVFTSNEREIFIRELQEGEAFITLDFAQKWLPSYYRETQKDFFGKPGYSWHISHVYAKVSGKLVQHEFIHIFKNEIQNGAIVVEIIKHMAEDLAAMGITKIHLRSDNAAYYHCASVMASIPEIAKNAKINIASWSFSESQSGKSSADRYASYCKTIMRVYLAKGKNIDTHEQMFVALTEGKGLRGMSVHLATAEFTSLPKTKMNGISTFGHFEFEGDTISAWKFRGIGEGVQFKGLKGITSSIVFHNQGGKLSRDGLKDEDKKKIADGQEPFYWFFPTKKVTTAELGDVDDEAVTGQAPVLPAESDPSPLFVCNECSASFIRYSNLFRHLENGRHKIRPEKVSQYDYALGVFKRMLEEVQQGVGIAPFADSFKGYEKAPKKPPAKGWAIRTTKKGVRYDVVANKMVTDLFEEYFNRGQKLRAEEVERRMRDRKDIAPSQRMTIEQIKNRIRTLLAEKKKAQHKNRNRRAVTFLIEWERESEEEGGMIEEEVDVDEDDRIITADAIYDMIYENMDELFDDLDSEESKFNLFETDQ